MLLTKLLLELNKKNYSKVCDLVAHRIREVRMAKGTGGTWEKAELVGLMPVTAASSTALPDGALAL